jgi:hypothetical protein
VSSEAESMGGFNVMVRFIRCLVSLIAFGV